jgi:hypothetical protein
MTVEKTVIDETGATGGLMHHMEKEHKKAYTLLYNQSSAGTKKRAATAQSRFGGAKRAKTKSKKNKECAELTARWVVKTLQPYSFVK